MSGAGAGVLSAVARAQYTAMARLRWRMFVNGLRSKLGAFELGARTVVFVIYALMGLGLGATMGITSFLLVSYQKWQFLPMLFWATCILWQWLPIMLASFQEQFDLSILLRFPVSFGPYYLLYVVFGLADVSTILGGVCCLSIWTGVTLARPGLCAWTALVLAIFAAFNILLVRAIFSWIDRWLSQRKTREIMGLAFMVLFLSLQLLNPALHQKRHLGVNHQQQAEQIRGEGATLQFFSNRQYRNPMVVRVAADGYQKGFGGHFHNDNSIAALNPTKMDELSLFRGDNILVKGKKRKDTVRPSLPTAQRASPHSLRRVCVCAAGMHCPQR